VQGSCDEESSARLIEENLKHDVDVRADSTIDEPSSRLATFKQRLMKKEREWGSDDDLSAARLEAENLNHAMERAAESEDEETMRARPVASPTVPEFAQVAQVPAQARDGRVAELIVVL